MFEKRIVNLSTAPPSRGMREYGVFDLPSVDRMEFAKLVMFGNRTPNTETLHRRASKIAKMAKRTGAKKACIDVPSCLISAVERELRRVDIEPVYPHGTIRRHEIDTDIEGITTVKNCYHLKGFITPPAE